MIAKCLFGLIGFAVLSAVLCVAGAVATYYLQGETMAMGLLRAWVFDFDGILVGAFGFGLLWFVRSSGNVVLAQLQNVLELPDSAAVTLVALHRRTRSWAYSAIISVPLTLVGGVALWNCHFPLSGFARAYLATCTISIYFVAASIGAFFLFTMAEFLFLERQMDHSSKDRLRMKADASPLDLDSIDSFFVLSATVGVIAIYLGFRGTLTGSFRDTPEVFRQLLVLPVLLFLPATLCYSLYPRMVLRKIANNDMLYRIQELEALASTANPQAPKERLEFRKLVLEVKEKIYSDTRMGPLLTFKDTLALTMSLVIVIQFILQHDKTVVGFLKSLLN